MCLYSGYVLWHHVSKALFTLPKLCRNSTDMSDQRCMWTRYVGNKTWPYFGKLNPLKRRISVPAQLFVPEQVQCERGLYLCRREVAMPIGHHKLCDRKWQSIYLFIVNSVRKYLLWKSVWLFNSFPLTLWVKAACFVLAIEVLLHARVLTLICACPIFKANFSHYKFSNANLRHF